MASRNVLKRAAYCFGSIIVGPSAVAEAASTPPAPAVAPPRPATPRPPACVDPPDPLVPPAPAEVAPPPTISRTPAPVAAPAAAPPSSLKKLSALLPKVNVRMKSMMPTRSTGSSSDTPTTRL